MKASNNHVIPFLNKTNRLEPSWSLREGFLSAIIAASIFLRNLVLIGAFRITMLLRWSQNILNHCTPSMSTLSTTPRILQNSYVTNHHDNEQYVSYNVESLFYERANQWHNKLLDEILINLHTCFLSAHCIRSM